MNLEQRSNASSHDRIANHGDGEFRPSPSRRKFLTAAVSLAVISSSWLPETAQASLPSHGPDLTSVDPDALEAGSAMSYFAKMEQYQQRGQLAPDSDPHLRRIRHIASQMIAISPRVNARAARWDWRVNLINDDDSRFAGWAMAGGKMAISSRTRGWTDDEIAVLMGHEVAHCLLEHVREGQARDAERREWTESSAGIRRLLEGVKRVEGAVGLGGVSEAAAVFAASAATMHYRRQDELEATNLGLELTARIGMDPRAAVALWVPSAQGGRMRSGLFDTHPTSWRHGKEITERALPRVLPIYEAVVNGRQVG